MIKIGKSIPDISFYSCQPNDKEELEKIIKERIKQEGPNCDLNDIDVSLITDMSYLFLKSKFNGDISRWDVSNVKDMHCMFLNSAFNGDISKWDVSNVKKMFWMFGRSEFNQDISKWDVSNVKDMTAMFSCSCFDCDISRWKLNKNCYTGNMFYKCPIKEEYKPKSLQKK